MRTRKPKQPQIVTKSWLAEKVKENPRRTIGRALVAIFRFQTEAEKDSNETQLLNGVGFSANDARRGSTGAKYYMKHGTLSDQLIKGWLKEDKYGRPKIVKYSKQLNQIAITKQINNEQNQLHLGDAKQEFSNSSC